MDFSNTPLKGKDLLNKDAIKVGERFKVNYLLDHMRELKLIDSGKKHEKFVKDMDLLLERGFVLKERQVTYLDGLFNKIFDEEL